MNLSENFTLAEMVRSQTAIRKGIDNTPTPEVIENLRALCVNVLQPIRNGLGRAVYVSSGYRSPKLNKAIGGSANSQHCRGEAADFTADNTDTYSLANWIHQNYRFDQLILEFYNPDTGAGWVHISWSPTEVQRQLSLTATRENGKVVYKQGIWK